MKLNIVVCDRCGAEIEPEEHGKLTNQAPKDGVVRHSDLCPDCYAEFIRFMRRDNARV